MKDFMVYALKEAEKAYINDEVPIGAVIVKDNKIIARGQNRREKTQNALMHAEICAINKACKKLKSWRLDGCQMYVTLEPCPMCAGAIVNARIEKVVYACKQTTSQDDLLVAILTSERLNHKVEVEQDIKYKKEASNLLTSFFESKRNK